MFNKAQLEFLNAIGVKIDGSVSPLPDAALTEIEDVAGNYLQIHGFDENYNPTETGKMCESILDHLTDVGNSSLLAKIHFLLSKAATKTYSPTEFTQIIRLAQHHSDHMILGKFMGYSASDYAIATLKWIGSTETQEAYNSIMETLPQYRKDTIIALIDNKDLYLEEIL